MAEETEEAFDPDEGLCRRMPDLEVAAICADCVLILKSKDLSGPCPEAVQKKQCGRLEHISGLF